MQLVEFTKMHGAGNDYIYVNALDFDIDNPSQCSVLWSNRHKGIGADGLVLIQKSTIADFKMSIYNADGSLARMCGNASRCVGKYVYEHNLTNKTHITLETLSGIKTLDLLKDQSGNVDLVSVDMGEPSFYNVELFTGKTFDPLHLFKIDSEGKTFEGRFVSIGNPHFVIFVDDILQINPALYGPSIENNPIFPEKTNVEFAQLIDDKTVRMRVWERGSGITMACGTGACATAAACVALFDRQWPQTIKMDGGDVYIQYILGRIILTGDAVEVFSGVISI